jgi:hypothetical protein
MAISNSTAALKAMFAEKYELARANGATDKQAIQACRALWLEALEASKASECCCDTHGNPLGDSFPRRCPSCPVHV